jgi:hypothetical protein
MDCVSNIHVVHTSIFWVKCFKKIKNKCLARVNQNAKILFIFSRAGIIVTYVYSQTAKLYSSTYTCDLLNMKRPI